jgi:predicted MFS family arabinose efflux permease
LRLHFDLSSSSELPTGSLILPTKAHAASLGNSWDISVQALIAVFFVSSFFAPLVFFGQSRVVLAGMVLWGIGMGAQNSLLRSVIAPLLRRDVRATGFGLFDTGFGVAWFLGSWVMGILYEKSILILVIFSVVLQLLSLLVFALAERAD